MVRDGYFYGVGFLAAALLVGWFTHLWALALIPLALAAFFLWFFRDPERAIPEEPGLVVSPADGKLTEIVRIQTPGGERIRLSIFLSVFDVHVNRSPVAGTLREVCYQKGEYLNALNPDSAVKNEQNIVTLESGESDVVFKQIAGLLARRIVFLPKPGSFLGRGERVGMIKFGSRVDVLLPAAAQLRVSLGQRVKGGSSILAELQAEHARPLREIPEESLESVGRL